MVAYEAVKDAIENAKAITILSHVNPDVDTLGTALGIYSLLIKDKSKKIEVVNSSKQLPLYLNFLPYYQKIKYNIEYENSLIIACDCASINRFGIDVSGREIINIDHHKSNTGYGSINIVVAEYAAASQVAFELFYQFMKVSKEAATCFYAGLLSDTQYFTTSTVSQEVFSVAKTLISLGAEPANIAYNFRQREPLSALRILEKALGSLTLKKDAKVAIMYVTKTDILSTGASIFDMEGLVDYAKSLATVEIAICAMELSSNIRISIRSKHVDVSSVALLFGGGGHRLSAGFSFTQYSLQESIDIILQKIEELSLLDNE